MRIINDKIEGDVRFEEDKTLSGMVVGNVTVGPGATLQLSGMVIGCVELQPSSRVALHGTVDGDVANHGGELEVWGVVNGRIYRQSGTTTVHPSAIVSGHP